MPQNWIVWIRSWSFLMEKPRTHIPLSEHVQIHYFDKLYITNMGENVNISMLTTRWVYFDECGRGIKALKQFFHRYLRSVCVNGALEQAERKSDTRSEKKTTSAQCVSESRSSSAFSCERLWGIIAAWYLLQIKYKNITFLNYKKINNFYFKK